MRGIILAIAAVASLVSPARAADPVIDCTFSSLHSFVLEDGIRKVEGAKPSDTIRVTFAELDHERNSAIMLGNLGSAKLWYRRELGKFAFIEVTDTGNMRITTVAAKGGSSWWGVHQRQSHIGGAVVVVSTYAGQCGVRMVRH
jgi:hypothetical protein